MVRFLTFHFLYYCISSPLWVLIYVGSTLNETIVDEKELRIRRTWWENNRIEDLKAKYKLEKIKRDARTRKG